MIILEIVNLDLQIFVIILILIPALTGKDQAGIEYQEVQDHSSLNDPSTHFTVDPINQDG